MPATAARATFIQSEFRKAVAVTSAPQTRYGDDARKSDDPIPTYFDNVADAQVIATARQALMGVERRVFRPTINDAASALALSYLSAAPTVSYVDTERSANMTALVSDVTIDLAKQAATFTIWG